MAYDTSEMERHLYSVLNDQSLRESLVASGLETIRMRHTCRHRMDELIDIYKSIAPRALREKPVEVRA